MLLLQSLGSACQLANIHINTRFFHMQIHAVCCTGAIHIFDPHITSGHIHQYIQFQLIQISELWQYFYIHQQA